MEDSSTVNVKDGIETVPISVEEEFGDVTSFVAITQIVDFIFSSRLDQFAKTGVGIDVEIGI